MTNSHYCKLPLTLLVCGILQSYPASLVAAEPTADSTTTEAAEETKKISIEVTGVDDQLKNNVLGNIDIYEFHDKEAPSRARVRYLFRAGEEQALKALAPLGYFRPTATSELIEEDNRWIARYDISPGDPIKLHKTDVQVLGAGLEDPEFNKALNDHPIKQGDVLNQQTYEELKKRFQVIASQRGYFDAKLAQNEILVNLKKYQAEVNLKFETGERYRLGDVSFDESHHWLRESLLDRYVEIEPGQLYESADLQQLQSDLANSEFYKQVEINASPDKANDERIIPVVVKLQPNKPRKYTYGIGYGTDTGARVTAGIVGRRVNDKGHHFSAEALFAQIKHGIAGEYVIPGKDPRTDTYGIRASYEDEHSDNRDYQAYNLGGYYKYRKGLWVKTYALDYRVEEFDLGNERPVSTLLIPSVDWTRTFPAELEKRIYVTDGTWLQLRLKGGADALLSDTNFIQPLVSAKWIHSFKNKHRVIARGTMGSTWVDDFDDLPSSLRFYTGGDRTVRGYEYNLIAPTQDDDVVGGKHLTEASLEYEIPFKPKWSYAVFVDTGDAFDEKPEYKSGAGLGVRWQSPIGPVRIDLGHGLDQPLGDDIRFHLTIGPDL